MLSLSGDGNECKPLLRGRDEPGARDQRLHRGDKGRAVQVDPIKTRVESAYGSSA
jgi:hypothetical protein